MAKREGQMPFGKSRTDVRKALEEALASRVEIRIYFEVLTVGRTDIGYVQVLSEDRVVVGRDKEGTRGLPVMLSDIQTVCLWQEPGDPPAPDPDPEPVGDPPPKAGSPGKREQAPLPDKTAKVVGH